MSYRFTAIFSLFAASSSNLLSRTIRFGANNLVDGATSSMDILSRMIRFSIREWHSQEYFSPRILDRDEKDFVSTLLALSPLARAIITGQLTSRDLYTCVKSKKKKIRTGPSFRRSRLLIAINYHPPCSPLRSPALTVLTIPIFGNLPPLSIGIGYFVF